MNVPTMTAKQQHRRHSPALVAMRRTTLITTISLLVFFVAILVLKDDCSSSRQRSIIIEQSIIVDAFLLSHHGTTSSNNNIVNVAHTMRRSSQCQGKRISSVSLKGIASNDDAEDDGGGAALAAEFAQFINKRDQEKKKKKQTRNSRENKSDGSSSSNNRNNRTSLGASSSSSSLPPQQPQAPFSKRKEVRVDKATGKPYDVPSSTKRNFLSAQNNVPYGSFGSFDNTRDPRNNMLPVSRMTLNSDELRLVRRAELSLIAQLVGGILLLFALLAIGTSGGITDGSDRFSSADFEEDMTPDYSIVTDGSDIVPERIQPSPSTPTALPTTTPFDEGLWI